MTASLLARLLGVWAVFTVVNSSGDKGSESHGISAEGTNEAEESAEHNAGKKKNTGAQQKFWIPTYPGSNPLNRRKIEITNSEIERFDSSIDESISGVIRNGTRAPRIKKKKPREREKDLSKLPFVWSGEDISHNITVKDLQSLESSLVTVESKRSSEDVSTEFKRNYSPFAWSPGNRSQSTSETSLEQSDSSSKSSSEESSIKKVKPKIKDEKSDSIHSTTKQDPEKVSPRTDTKTTKKKVKTTSKSETDQTTKKTLKFETKPTKKSEVSHFSDKSETNSDEKLLSKEYYRKMVDAAVENTKRKLGYRKLSQTSQPLQTFKPIVPGSLSIDSKDSEPEIFKVNLDSKSFDSTHTQDEIQFETKHDQFATMNTVRSDTVKPQGKQKTQDKKDRVKTLARELSGSPKEEKVKGNYTESENDEIYKKQKDTDFPSSCDYDAWSDVLLKNRTQRKSKQRKPKTGKLSSSFERSSGDMRAWPGKKIKDKAEELRKKEGKLTRKDKRKRAQKKVEKRQKVKKEAAKRKYYDGSKDDYNDSPGAEKDKVRKKTDHEDSNSDDAYHFDDSQTKGKGGAGKTTDYDYAYNEDDYSSSPEQRKKKPVKKKGYDEKEDYDYSDKPKRKFRMTSEGEKRHAYKEVKEYLKDMDKEYGGRPGGETYRGDRKRDKGYDRRDSRGGGRGRDRRGYDRGNFRTGGRDRGRFDRESDRGRFDRGSNRGRFDRGGEKWNDRDGRDGRDGRDDQWERGWGRDDRDKGRDRRGREQDDRRGTWGGGGRRGGGSRGGGGRGWGRGGGRGRGGRGRGGRGGGRRRY